MRPLFCPRCPDEAMVRTCTLATTEQKGRLTYACSRCGFAVAEKIRRLPARLRS